MTFLKFLDFVQESKENDTKIQMVKIKPIITTTDNKKLLELNKKALNVLYELVILEEIGPDIYNSYELNKNQPILWLAGAYPKYAKFLQTEKNKSIKENEVYNYPSQASLNSASKVKFHKLLNEYNFIPTTVFSSKEAEKLKFPIVGKPDNRTHGQGIQVLKSVNELKNNSGKFDLFSEFVDFDREFRALYLKDKLFSLYERIPIEKDNKTILTKNPEEPVKFVYIEQDKHKIEYDIFKLLDYARKIIAEKIPLDFYSLDFFLDKKNKVWIIETNSASGLGSNSLCKAYECIYEDFYNKKVDTNIKNFIDEICSKHNEVIKSSYPEEFKQSKAALDG